jgi:hypothetical protein
MVDTVRRDMCPVRGVTHDATGSRLHYLPSQHVRASRATLRMLYAYASQPESCFDDDAVSISGVQRASGQNGVKIKKLMRGRHPEADKLLDWVVHHISSVEDAASARARRSKASAMPCTRATSRSSTSPSTPIRSSRTTSWSSTRASRST